MFFGAVGLEADRYVIPLAIVAIILAILYQLIIDRRVTSKAERQNARIRKHYFLKAPIDLTPNDAPMETRMPQLNHSGQSSRKNLNPSAM